MAALELANLSTLWSSKSFFYAPSISVNSLRNCGSLESCFFRPLNKRKGFAIKCNVPISRSIPVLLLWRFPLNIAWLVISFVINSSKRMLFTWSKTNILQKIGKIFPSFADRNTSAAVSMVAIHRWVFATTNHGMPSIPFLSSFVGSTMSMFNFHKSSNYVKCHAILHDVEAGG